MKILTNHITTILSAFTISVTGLFLVGMIWNTDSIKEKLPGLADLKILTSVCFLIAALALIAFNKKELTIARRVLGSFLGYLVLGISFLTICDYIFGWNIFAGRMPLAAAILFFLISIVLLLIPKRSFHYLVHVILLAGGVFLLLIFIIDISRLQSSSLTSFFNETILHSRFLFLALFTAAFFSHPLEYLKFSFQKKVTAVFVFVAVVLTIIFLVFENNNRRSVNTARQVDQTQMLILNTQEIRTQTAEMQNAFRGFIITGEEIYLPLFTNATAVIEENILRLKSLTQESPDQQVRIDKLKQLITAFITSRKVLIHSRNTANFSNDKIKLILREGKEVIDEARKLIVEIQADEKALLAERRSKNDQTIENSKLVITVFQVIAVLLLLSGFLVIYNNTRRRNKAEKQLEQYKHFFNNSNDFSAIANIDGHFEILNPNFEKILGYSEKELLENPFLTFVHPDDIAATLQEVDKLKNGAITSNFINRYRRKDGTYLYFDWNTTPDPRTGKLYAIARDITERKKLEDQLMEFNRELEQKIKERTEELAKSEKRFRALIENSTDGISLIDSSRKLTYQSPAAENITGYTMEDRMNDFRFTNIHPEEIDKADQIYDEILAHPDKAMPLMFRVIHKQGHVIWIEGTATNLLNDECVKAIVINFRDVTHRVEAEKKLKKFAEELQSSNTELERFAYVASHDLQEPLRMVSSFMNLLVKKLDGQLDDTTRQYIHFAVDGSERMKVLIQDLLQYSRVGANKENFVLTDINEVMNYAKRLLKEDITKQGASITVQQMPVVNANKTLISQLFVNLISNALKYQNGSPPKIEIGSKEEAQQWTFYVKDNGIGIDKKFFDKIFIIFQRLHSKSEYSGTGIGLAICKKIVDIHKGKIWVDSETGKGSTFYFTIPKNIS